MQSSFCSRLPKLELHAHLNGSLSHKTLKELLCYHQKNGLKAISDVDTSVLFKETYTLSEFFLLFKTIYNLTSTSETVKLATERVIEDFFNDNVVYLELRSTLREENGMTKREYISSIIQGVLFCKKQFPGILVKIIVSINRSETLESAAENVNLAIEYKVLYPNIIVGIDLSGNPEKKNFNDYLNLLETARNNGLKITIHCAEVVGNEEIANILSFCPNRIGHGTCINESFGGNLSNWNDLLNKKIPVELCLTSNIKCHTVESYSKHHFKILYSVRHPIALATDDKGVFDTSLTKEFEIIQNVFKLTEEELWELSFNSIDYIFGNESEKEMLRALLNQWKKKNYC